MLAAQNSSTTLLTLGGAALTTWLAIHALRRISPRDATSAEAHKRDQAPIPLVGGALALLGFAAAPLLTESALVPAFDVPWPILAGVAFSSAVGFLDDARKARGFPWPLKLLGQALAAAFVFAVDESKLSCSPILAFLALLILQNAWNFFDNADACVASVAGAALAVHFTHGAHDSSLSLLLLALLAGYLPHNWPPARAYLGDAGAHGLAYALTWIALTHPAGPARGLAGLHALVLLDLVQVLCVRLAIGWAPWRGDRRHLAHRLRGILPPSGVTLILASSSAAIAALVFGVF